MALPEYQIGPFRFLGINGPMNTAHPRSEVITRPGLPGGEIWRTRRQPVPFTVQTMVDCIQTSHAYEIYRAYQRLSNRDSLLTMVWDDVRSDDGIGLATNYYVLDVNVVAVQKCLAYCGRALYGGSGAIPVGASPPSALLTCEWLLLPFDAGYSF